MNIDKELKNLKIKDIKVPDRFKELARNTLNGIGNLEEEKKSNRKEIKIKRYIKVAILFLALTSLILFRDSIVSAYNKLRGYEKYFSYSSYLKELNEENKIQIINEKVIFSNGLELLIEGLFYDGKYLTLFSKEIKKDNISFDDENEFLGIHVEDKGPNLLSIEDDINGNTSYITTYDTREYLDEINFKIKLGKEEKDLNIKIDKSKVMDSKIIEVNQEISANGVNVILKEVRVSANTITPTYIISSDNKELVQKIKDNKNHLFEEGISTNFWVDIKGNEFTSSINEDVKEVDNGIEVEQQLYSKDLRLDKMKELKIKLIGIYFAEEINLDKLKENAFYDEDLYIYEINKKENKMLYFVRYEKDFNLSSKYIIGYASSYMIDFQGREDIKEKEFLGEDYKEFNLGYVSIDTISENKVILTENKLFKMSQEDRTFKINLKN